MDFSADGILIRHARSAAREEGSREGIDIVNVGVRCIARIEGCAGRRKVVGSEGSSRIIVGLDLNAVVSKAIAGQLDAIARVPAYNFSEVGMTLRTCQAALVAVPLVLAFVAKDDIAP